MLNREKRRKYYSNWNVSSRVWERWTAKNDRNVCEYYTNRCDIFIITQNYDYADNTPYEMPVSEWILHDRCFYIIFMGNIGKA